MSPKKTASTKSEVSKPEVNFHCVVLRQPDRSLVKFGGMLCGPGTKKILSQSQAEAAEKRGWVKIVGQA
jgi:hypothetical protein